MGDAEENDLTVERRHFDGYLEEEVRLETCLSNQRIMERNGVDFDVTPHPLFLPHKI
jgi:hypothetical protein